MAWACATTAHALPQSLAFTFAPLQCTSTSYRPALNTIDCGLTALSGSFTFDDANGDGHVVRSELLQLTAGGITAPGPGYDFTEPAQVFTFDYAAATGLSFSAYDGWRLHVTTGVSYRYDSPGGTAVDAWLPTTTAAIYPVPEPGSFWLLLAGSAALACRLRWPFAQQQRRNARDAHMHAAQGCQSVYA